MRWLDDTVPVVPGSWRNPCIWKVVGKSRILWFVQKSQKSTAIIVLDVSLLFEAMTKIKNSQNYYRTDKIDKFEIQWDNDSDLGQEVMMIVMVIVRRAGLLWSQQDFEWLWSVPLSSASLYWEFSFILFDLCLFITIFNFILNYVPTVTFWIFTYHKIWILLIIFCFIWSYWIIYFLTCLEVFWSVVS